MAPYKHQGSMKICISHIRRLSGESRVIPKEVQNGVRGLGKQIDFGVLLWLWVGSGERTFVFRSLFAWFELPTSAKKGRTQTFYSSCPDMGQKGEERGGVKTLSHQT